MTLEEKIGQLAQVNGDFHDLHDAIREGRIGSVLNEVDVEKIDFFNMNSKFYQHDAAEVVAE